MLYWIAQGLFAAAFLVAATVGSLSPFVLAASAAIQLGLVGWRLWIARAKPWPDLHHSGVRHRGGSRRALFYEFSLERHVP